MKIGFIWQGISIPKQFENWNDGLRVAMKEIEKIHEVRYFEPWDNFGDCDVLLYWEAPLTINGKNQHHYIRVKKAPYRKALLFAGGPIKRQWVDGFQLLFLESKKHEKECDDEKVLWHHAFGVNNELFRPMNVEKKYDGMLHGTGHSGKRQNLIAEALGNKALVCGKDQETDTYPFQRCRELGVTMFPELNPSEVVPLINSSYSVVNLANEDSGGQRATLEAMACGIPPIVSRESTKNREFVEEAGFGLVIDPNVQAIRDAVKYLKENPQDPMIGVNYVREKFNGKLYAEQILEGLKKII